MKERNFTSEDGTVVNISVWDEVSNPKAAVYIAHGMAEYGGRYDRFATFLNQNGYVVWASDERGHGKTAKVKGVVEPNSFDKTVEDTGRAIELMKEEYGLKVFLVGHSYGSAVSQRYLQLYSDLVCGAILSGTSYFKNAATSAGRIAAKLGKLFVGAEKPAKLIEKLSFGMYSKQFPDEGKNAWLSRDKAEVEKYNEDPNCGFILSYGFYDAFFERVHTMYKKDFKKVRSDLLLMIAVGTADPVSNGAKLAKKLYSKYIALKLPATLKLYEGARHEILNETNKELVMSDMLRFIDFCCEEKE